MCNRNGAAHCLPFSFLAPAAPHLSRMQNLSTSFCLISSASPEAAARPAVEGACSPPADDAPPAAAPPMREYCCVPPGVPAVRPPLLAEPGCLRLCAARVMALVKRLMTESLWGTAANELVKGCDLSDHLNPPPFLPKAEHFAGSQDFM